ncbi:MAG: TetR/AcrR family transcriptional regulator [Candidatus Geothermincolia bacterium]
MRGQPTSSRRTEREARREKIMKASLKVFVDKGYQAATISDLIRAACVARRTFYNYFESKKDVFLELVQSYFEQYTAILEKSHANLVNVLEHNPEGTIDAWRRLVLAVLEFHSQNRDLTILVYREAQTEDEHFTGKVQELIQFAREHMIRDFQLMAERGLLVDMDIDFATTMINSAVMTIVLDHVLRKPNLDLKAIADQLVRYQARALAPDRSVVDQAFA